MPAVGAGLLGSGAVVHPTPVGAADGDRTFNTSGTDNTVATNIRQALMRLHTLMKLGEFNNLRLKAALKDVAGHVVALANAEDLPAGTDRHDPGHHDRVRQDEAHGGAPAFPALHGDPSAGRTLTLLSG